MQGHELRKIVMHIESVEDGKEKLFWLYQRDRKTK